MRNICYICSIDRNTVRIINLLTIKVRQILWWLWETYCKRPQFMAVCVLHSTFAIKGLYWIHRYRVLRL